MDSLSILIVDEDVKKAKEIVNAIKNKNKTGAKIETKIVSKLPKGIEDYDVFLISDKIGHKTCIEIKEQNPFSPIFLLSQTNKQNYDYDITGIISSYDTDIKHVLKIAEEIIETRKRINHLSERMSELDDCYRKLVEVFSLNIAS